jgi:hypothetical protein
MIKVSKVLGLIEGDAGMVAHKLNDFVVDLNEQQMRAMLVHIEKEQHFMVLELLLRNRFRNCGFFRNYINFAR